MGLKSWRWVCSLRKHPLEVVVSNDGGGVIHTDGAEKKWAAPFVNLRCSCGKNKAHYHGLSALFWHRNLGLPTSPPPVGYTEFCPCGYEG